MTGHGFCQHICTILESPTDETATLLDHAFTKSRLDYRILYFIELQVFIITYLSKIVPQHTKMKYDPLTSTVHDDQHWLSILQMLQF